MRKNADIPPPRKNKHTFMQGNSQYARNPIVFRLLFCVQFMLPVITSTLAKYLKFCRIVVSYHTPAAAATTNGGLPIHIAPEAQVLQSSSPSFLLIASTQSCLRTLTFLSPSLPNNSVSPEKLRREVTHGAGSSPHPPDFVGIGTRLYFFREKTSSALSPLVDSRSSNT